MSEVSVGFPNMHLPVPTSRGMSCAVIAAAPATTVMYFHLTSLYLILSHFHVTSSKTALTPLQQLQIHDMPSTCKRVKAYSVYGSSNSARRGCLLQRQGLGKTNHTRDRHHKERSKPSPRYSLNGFKKGARRGVHSLPGAISRNKHLTRHPAGR